MQESGRQPFPTLFDFSAQACVNHIEYFADFCELEYEPFGHALVQQFRLACAKHNLSTRQIQAAIVLFAEAYGQDHLEPEWTGYRCFDKNNLRHLSGIGHALVYLDLSTIGRHVESLCSLKDDDMVMLATMSGLKILDLSNTKIGDSGWGHLVRSVQYGQGPTELEYLSLSGTFVTDQGIGRLWDLRRPIKADTVPFVNHTQNYPPGRRTSANLVFRSLLGIDLTDTPVSLQVATAMFQMDSLWTRLEPTMRLLTGFRPIASEKPASNLLPNDYFCYSETSVPIAERWRKIEESALGVGDFVKASKSLHVAVLPLPDSPPLQPMHWSGHSLRPQRRSVLRPSITPTSFHQTSPAPRNTVSMTMQYQASMTAAVAFTSLVYTRPRSDIQTQISTQEHVVKPSCPVRSVAILRKRPAQFDSSLDLESPPTIGCPISGPTTKKHPRLVRESEADFPSVHENVASSSARTTQQRQIGRFPKKSTSRFPQPRVPSSSTQVPQTAVVSAQLPTSSPFEKLIGLHPPRQQYQQHPPMAKPRPKGGSIMSWLNTHRK